MFQVPTQALDLAKQFEGWRSSVYLCPAGYPTIGYGHRCDPDHPDITPEEGEMILESDMEFALFDTYRYCPVLIEEPPERVAAICDFTFNLGPGRLKISTLRKRINARQWNEAAYELSRWVWGGGRKLPGLIARRDAEATLLLSVGS